MSSNEKRKRTTPTSDFMIDFREGIMSIPTYFNWLGWFTNKKPTTFGRLSSAFGAILIAIFVPTYFFGKSETIFPNKIAFILPTLLLLIAMLWIAYLIIKPQKTQSSFEVGWLYFISKLSKRGRYLKRFGIISIRDGMVIYDNKSIGMCFEIGGAFSATMFDSDIEFLRSKIYLNRNRLSENITTISIVQIGNTDFKSQKKHLERELLNTDNPYRKKLLQETQRYFESNLKSEQVLKSYYEFKVHSNEEKRQVEELLRNYHSDGILTFYRYLNKEELIKMKEEF